MKRTTKGLIAFVALGGGVAVFCLMFVGLPRMYNQAHIRTGRAPMPPSPEGAIPVVDPVPPVPTTQQAEAILSGLTPSQENVSRGKVYYGYYCVQCHGDAGDGRGPVGGGYIPTPADLRSSRVQSLSNGALYRAMLTGEGHTPVLERVVLPGHRAYLVLYIRSLREADASRTKPAP